MESVALNMRIILYKPNLPVNYDNHAKYCKRHTPACTGEDNGRMVFSKIWSYNFSDLYQSFNTIIAQYLT